VLFEIEACDFSPQLLLVSRGSEVGIVTAYGLDDREVGVRVPIVSEFFSSPNRPD
jgi:hypothetical protein